MKVVGKYKDYDISVTDVLITQTYGDYLCLSEDSLLNANNDILKGVDKRVSKLWGENRPIYIADPKINEKNKLPEISIYAWLTCYTPINDAIYCGSQLVLVCLEESPDDIFGSIEKRLKRIRWDCHAKDFDI